MADIVLEALARHLEHFQPGEDGLIATSTDGRPVHRSAFAPMWRHTATRAGLPDVRFHDLRHYAASALIASGSSVKTVQRFLGHKSATVTLDTYGHLWPDAEEVTRGAIQAALARPLVSSSCPPDAVDG